VQLFYAPLTTVGFWKGWATVEQQEYNPERLATMTDPFCFRLFFPGALDYVLV
jgi:hypothetical protein